MKLKNSNGDKPKKIQMVTKLKKKKKIVTKLKKLNCEKTKQNSNCDKTQIVTKLKLE